MAKYRVLVTFPDDITAALEAFTEVGELVDITGHSAQFTFEARNLWDARGLVEEALGKANGFNDGFNIGYPSEAEEPHSIDG